VLLQVWFYDGTVDCFVDAGHTVLTLFGLILFTCFSATFVMLIVCMFKPNKVSYIITDL
jgi:hypothetical protein